MAFGTTKSLAVVAIERLSPLKESDFKQNDLAGHRLSCIEFLLSVFYGCAPYNAVCVLDIWDH